MDLAVPEDLLAIKSLLALGRQEVEAMHRERRPSREVAAALTDLCDRTVKRVYHQALAAASPADRLDIIANLSLVAVGGYGRRDLAPYSDLDLLFLTGPADKPALRPFVSRMVRDLWDVGLALSHGVRGTDDCISLARADLTACTAVAEARFLIGGNEEFPKLQRAVHKLFTSLPINRFISEIESERAKEHHDYHAQTVLLLEPNVKKSPGGLRDYHTLRWIALARHGLQDPEMLKSNGTLPGGEADTLARACEFLQAIRAEMHYFARSAQDVLTRDEQLRLAEWMGFGDDGQLLGVERFMQHYYKHTTGLRDVVTRFMESARKPAAMQRIRELLATDRVEQHFLLTRRTIGIAPDARQTVLARGEHILHLFDIARDFDVAITHETMELVRGAIADLPVNMHDLHRFLRLLANPMNLGKVLRGMDHVGLIARLLPPFAHAHCLIQFNMYHKYTVDEHSLRAVEAAVRRQDEQSPLGRAYREIRRKDLLHLAVLLHDLGKGLGEDHCEIGRQITEQVAGDFGLDEHDTSVLCFLVHQHLLMATTAFRRDLNDEATLVQFARAVATPEMLRMLYVLTAADTEAVSAENWTPWKETLLNELYLRTMEELTGEAPVADEPTRRTALSNAVIEDLASVFPREWLTVQIELMPLSYLESTRPAEIRRHLEVLQEMPASGVHVHSEHLPRTGLLEYTVFTRDDITEGLFSKVAGTLAAVGFQVVSARIITRSDGLVVDSFAGQDLTFSGEPPANRRAEVAEKITDVLLGRRDVEKLFPRRRPMAGPDRGGRHRVPPKVEIDNESSARCTIIEVFTEDRLGLLYTITRTLFELELSVTSARINTHADSVVDVFYVTTRSGKKPTGEPALQKIRRRLLDRLAV